MRIFVADIGGSAIKHAVSTGTEELSEQRRTDTPRTYDAFLDAMIHAAGNATEIVLAIPGAYDHEKHQVAFCPNIPWLTNTTPATDLSRILGIPVYAENDANLAALGEYRYGGHGSPSIMVFLTLGTGIGGGMIYHGKLFAGSITAFEAGHIPVVPDGKLCGCGRKGCLEAYAGQAGLLSGYRASDGRFCAPNAAALARLASDGDDAAKEAFSLYAGYLATGCAAITNLVAPDCILFGGGISELSEHFLSETIEQFEEKVFPAFRGRVQLKKATLGNRAGMAGAVAYALSQRG